MSSLFRYFQNGFRSQVKDDHAVELDKIGIDPKQDFAYKEEEIKDDDKGKDEDDEDYEDEDVFVLANSQTEEGEISLEIVYENTKPGQLERGGENTDVGSPKMVGDGTLAGEVWERMNSQANVTSAAFQDTTLAKVLSEAALSPVEGDKTMLWRKYNDQADASHFPDTTLCQVLSQAVLSPETKEKTAPGDQSVLWRKFNNQADMTNFQDTTLCQILDKAVVSPVSKTIDESKKRLSKMGDKTMLKNMWKNVNSEGEVTLMGRIDDVLENDRKADLPSPLQSQVICLAGNLKLMCISCKYGNNLDDVFCANVGKSMD